MHSINSAVGQRERHVLKMLQGMQGPCVMSFETGVRQNLRAVIKAKWARRKIVREINEWPLSVTWGESRIKQWIEIHILTKLFDGFICISDMLVDFCRKHGKKGVPVFKLPMTVDVESIDQIVESVDAAEGLPIRQSGNFTIAYAGGMTEEKDGVETLKQAVAQVNANREHKIELDLISGVSHDEALRRLYAADCLVLARPDSLQARAGFPTKIGEYLALGKSVIVSPVGEIPRYLTDGKDALIGWDIANKIKWVLNHPDEAKRIGAAGREAALREFDWHVHAEELREWLKTI